MAQVYRRIELEAAIIASTREEFDHAAARVEKTAKALAPKDTTDFARSIKRKTTTTPQGVHDQTIYSDDPAALSIEYGHITPAGNYVPGHHTFAQTKRKLDV